MGQNRSSGCFRNTVQCLKYCAANPNMYRTRMNNVHKIVWWGLSSFSPSHFLNRTLWYTCVIRTNKMRTYFVNDLILLYCLRHVSSKQVFIHRKTCICSFVRMHERNTIKMHVQVFLRMKTCLVETCRRQYNWIKSLLKKVCILLVLITYSFSQFEFHLFVQR